MRIRGFGELEAAVMDRLWSRDPRAEATSVREVFETLFDAIVLVALVVLVFLQNWRSTLAGPAGQPRPSGVSRDRRPGTARETHHARHAPE